MDMQLVLQGFGRELEAPKSILGIYTWSLSSYLGKWVQVPVFMGSCPIF